MGLCSINPVPSSQRNDAAVKGIVRCHWLGSFVNDAGGITTHPLHRA